MDSENALRMMNQKCLKTFKKHSFTKLMVLK